MSLGIAVIGAGMAGKAHAAAYRAAAAMYAPTLPELRYVSIADVNADLAAATATRFGYERSDTSWQAIAAADDIDVVSVVIANSLHREVVEGLLEAGKHVLCEKPLSDTMVDARAMAVAADAASTVARIGLTYRRSPGIAAIRNWIADGTLGPRAALLRSLLVRLLLLTHRSMELALRRPHGIGSARRRRQPHVLHRGVPVRRHGGRIRRRLQDRDHGPSAAARCRGRSRAHSRLRRVPRGDQRRLRHLHRALRRAPPAASRRPGSPRGTRTGSTSRCSARTARPASTRTRPPRSGSSLHSDQAGKDGYRTVNLGAGHPYLAGGIPMDSAGVGFGQNECFAFQAGRSSRRSPASTRQRRCPATRPSRKASTTWRSWRRSQRPQPTTEGW